jgi:hypothetical protein
MIERFFQEFAVQFFTKILANKTFWKFFFILLLLPPLWPLALMLFLIVNLVWFVILIWLLVYTIRHAFD